MSDDCVNLAVVVSYSDYIHSRSNHLHDDDRDYCYFHVEIYNCHSLSVDREIHTMVAVHHTRVLIVGRFLFKTLRLKT